MLPLKWLDMPGNGCQMMLESGKVSHLCSQVILTAVSSLQRHIVAQLLMDVRATCACHCDMSRALDLCRLPYTLY